MSTVSLNAALSGLKAAQNALNTVSTNIANAATPGYTRKILPQETVLLGGMGVGVKTGGLIRNVDTTLLKDIFKQTSISQGALVKQSYLDRIVDFHGASEAEQSVAARIGKLEAAFANLSAAPHDSLMLGQVVNAAQNVASSFNDFSELVSNLRMQTETEISAYATEVNAQLEKIAQLNIRISNLTSGGQSTADLEDQRDIALRKVSEYMQVSTYINQDNVMVVNTKQGQLLADTTAHKLVFSQTLNISATHYYPGGGLSGLRIDSAGGIEITSTAIGGKIGALFDMRDNTLPTYQAQMDELAQKMAERLDSLGLRLFTDGNGNVPASVAPPAPVTYTGFAANIQVNRHIVNDPTLLRSGTGGGAAMTGSTDVIDRISKYGFGNFIGQTALGTADISVGTIFAATGMTQSNSVIGNMNLNAYTPDLSAAPNITPPTSFTLTIGGVPANIAINPGDTPADLVNTINAAFPGVATLNSLGQLALNATADIDIADNGIGAAGIADLGLGFGTFNAVNPSFTVQVGSQSPVTITIAPGDTEAQLLAALNAVPGLTAMLVGGALQLTPDEGGSLTLNNVNGTPLNVLGMSLSNISAPAFRQNNLGPSGTLSTGLPGSANIGDYATRLVSAHAADYSSAESMAEQEEAYLATLDARSATISGVDIDQEIAELIRLQTAYTAAARMISATEEMFNQLLNSV
jgi:flagellar hook-associated protein 1 FlgK